MPDLARIVKRHADRPAGRGRPGWALLLFSSLLLVPGAAATIMVRGDPRRFAPRSQVVPVRAGGGDFDAGVIALEPARPR